jgi:signal transduction histidine kinase
MKTSASNLYKLLDNLLQWSSIQRGLIEFNPGSYMLSPIVKQNIEIIKENADQKNIEIVENITDDIQVTADLQMLNTILRNLISNAVKFTPKYGNVEISAIMKPSDGFIPSEKSVVIYVKDSGIGMDSFAISHLFKIDKNISRPGTEQEPSTGLGLLLCKEFVEKHDGKIWVESVEDRGSTFYFSLTNVK